MPKEEGSAGNVSVGKESWFLHQSHVWNRKLARGKGKLEGWCSVGKLDNGGRGNIGIGVVTPPRIKESYSAQMQFKTQKVA